MIMFLLSLLQRNLNRDKGHFDPGKGAEPGGGVGSTDPLLQIPDELSAVLTLKRGVNLRSGLARSAGSAPPDKGKSRTPLLKRKRESIV